MIFAPVIYIDNNHKNNLKNTQPQNSLEGILMQQKNTNISSSESIYIKEKVPYTSIQ